MEKQTFEVFLQYVHSELFPDILDDDLPDHFDTWMSDMDVERCMKWAELYGKDQYIAGKGDALLNK